MPGITDVKAGGAYVELFTKDSRYVRGLRNAEQMLKKFGSNVQQLGRRMMGLGAALAAPLGVGVASYAKLDDALRRVEARSSGTAAEMEGLREQAKELGRTTSFTADQVGQLQDIIAKRGFTRSQILEQTPAILDFARAAGEGKDQLEDITNAATLAAGALNAWDLPATDTTKVADLMTAAINGSALSMESLQDSLRYVAPLAADAGYSLQDTLQVLGELSNVWIEGSMGGTAFRRIMIELSDKLEQLGKQRIDIENSAGGLRDLGDIMKDLDATTKDMSKPERLAFFEELFGARGVTAASALARTKEASDKLRESLNNADGAAQRTAKHMDSGLGGALRKLWSAVEGAFDAIGEAIAGPITGLQQAITPLIQLFIKWVEQNKQLVVGWALVAGGLLVGGAALVAMGWAVNLIAAGIAGLITILTTFGAIVAFITSPIGMATIGIIALADAIFDLPKVGAAAFDWLKKSFATLSTDVDTTLKGIEAALAKGNVQQAAQVLWAGLQVIWKRGTNGLLRTWIGAKTSFLNITSDITAGIASLFVELRARLEEIWAATIDSLTTRWNGFVDGLKAGFGFAVEPLVPGEAFGGYTPEQAVDRLSKIAETDTGAENKVASERRAQDIESRRRAAQEKLWNETERAKRERATDAGREMANAAKELTEAIRRRDEAVAAARAQAAVSPPSTFPAQQKATEAAKAADSITKATSAVGTFSARAAGYLGGSQTQRSLNNIDKNTSKMAESFEGLADELRAGLQPGNIFGS